MINFRSYFCDFGDHDREWSLIIFLVSDREMIANHIALPKPLDFILYHVFLYTFWVEGIYFQRKIHKFIPKALDLRIFDILTSWAFRIYGSFLRKMPSVYLDFRKAWTAKWSPIMIVIWSLRILTKWSWVIVDHIMVKVSWVIVDHKKCDRTLLWSIRIT